MNSNPANPAALYDRSVALLALTDRINETRAGIDGTIDHLLGGDAIDPERSRVFYLLANSTASFAEALAADLRRAANAAWLHTTDKDLAAVRAAIDQQAADHAAEDLP